MSKTCPKCKKTFTRTNDLVYHLKKKKIPCDLKCPSCGVQSKTVAEFKIHEEDHHHHHKPEHTQKTGELTIVGNNVRPIPVQDFDLSILRACGLTLDDVEFIGYTDEQQEDIMTTATYDGNDELAIKRHTVIIRDQTIRIRIKNAKNAITNNMLYGAMCCMVPTQIEMPQLNRIATNMMYDVLHHDDPRLHNICLSDVTRGTVRMLSRIQETDKSYWAVHPKDIATKLINEHARNLFNFMLEAGIQTLAPAIWRRKHLCVALNGELGWSVILYEDAGALIADKVRTPELVYSQVKEDVAGLMQLVQTRKYEVIGLLRNLIIENEELKKCLEECRRFTYITMQRTM